MRLLIIAAILIYQKIAPKSLRQLCIFRHSCSNYVLEGARRDGTLEAFARFRRRLRCCRPGYSRIDTTMSNYDGPILVRLVDGSVIEGHELSERLRREFGVTVPQDELHGY
ncbi:MAG: membrane protein insertion efficiency factor YidD [Rhodospirillaceae bacterium]|nr:membrane protein insertion efficiency factor YidD [Rhodospirillaceae bacterium]